MIRPTTPQSAAGASLSARVPRWATAFILGLLVSSIATACVPTERGKTSEIRRESDTKGEKAPVLPETDPSAQLVAKGIRYDLRERSDDQDYWTPTTKEASCIADKVVTEVGTERLSALGYKPGIDGAGLNNIALSDDEKGEVLKAFTDCVAMEQAAAALLFGRGRISASAATCFAKILDKADLIPVFFESWLYATPIDPFADDGLLAETMSAGAQVCIDASVLNWPTLRSPLEGQDLIDADAPAGWSDSNHPDDRRLREEGSD